MNRHETRASNTTIKALTFALACACMAALSALLLVALARYNLAAKSNIDHGSTLNEVAFRLSMLDYEAVALFDQNGSKLLEWTNRDTWQVKTPANLIKLANRITFGAVTMLHNHPVDATFSVNDLVTASETNCKRQMVVSPNFLYCLEAPQDWPSVEEVRNFLAREVYDNPTAIQDGLLIQGDIVVDNSNKVFSTDRLIMQYAQEFNLVYTVKAINS